MSMAQRYFLKITLLSPYGIDFIQRLPVLDTDVFLQVLGGLNRAFEVTRPHFQIMDVLRLDIISQFLSVL